MRDAGYPDQPSDICGQLLRAIILVEIDSFTAIRRVIGPRNIGQLQRRLVHRIAAVLVGADILPVGRNLVEICFEAVDRARLDRSIDQLRALTGEPFAIGDVTVQIALRLGVAECPVQRADMLLLIEEAETALERDCAESDVAMGATPSLSTEDVATAHDLLAAIDRDELVLHYQPKLHVRREAITSVEALVRWSHPQRGLIMPGEFIPQAERSGTIGALTLWTLSQVVADQRVLTRYGYDLPIFVNIAGVLLSDRTFIDAVLALIEDSGVKLGFEITETSVICEPERAVAHLKELAAVGVAIAIDDYGAGLSSLAYLKQLPACELKIDKLFVTQLSSSHRDPLIVRSTIDLAHALEMEVVAEGVETASSLALLSVMGCDVVQGFLISRPLAFEALIVFLREERHRAVLARKASPFERLSSVRAQA